MIESDLLATQISPESFDLIHAALIFEYLDPALALSRIAPWIRRGGTLTVVLQQPSALSRPVTPTPYRSLEALSPILHLVDPDEFCRLAQAHELEELESQQIGLQQVKSFRVGRYRRIGD